MNWYLARNKKRLGPFSLARLKELADDGKLSPKDHLLREGTTKWLNAADVPGLFDASPPAKMAPRKPAKSSQPLSKNFWIAIGVSGAVLLAIMLAFAFMGKQPANEPSGDPQAKNPEKKTEPLSKEPDKDGSSKDRLSKEGSSKEGPKEKNKTKGEPQTPALSADTLRVAGTVTIEPVERTDPLGDKQLRYTINQVRINLTLVNELDEPMKLGNTMVFVEMDDGEQMEGVLAGFRLPDEPDIARAEDRWSYKMAYGVTTIESRYANGRRFTFVGPVRAFDLFSVINNTRWQEDSKADIMPTDLPAKQTAKLNVTFNRMYWIKDDARRTVRIGLPEFVAPGGARYRALINCKKTAARTWDAAETQLLPLTPAGLGPLVNHTVTMDKAVLAANWWVDADAKSAFPGLARQAEKQDGGRLLHAILQLAARHKDDSCQSRARALLAARATKLDINVAAASYLAALGDDPDVSALIAVASGPNDEQAAAVIYALAQLKSPKAIAGLRKLLLDTSLAARHRQIQANLDLIDKSANVPSDNDAKNNPKSPAKADARLALSPKDVGRADALLFSPDGKKLLLGNTQQGRLDGRVSIWNIAEGKKDKDLIAGRLHFATTLALSPDGKLLAMGGIVQMTLNDAVTGKNVSALGESATVVAFSADGKIFLSNGGDLDGKIKVWDVNDPKTDPSRPTPATRLRAVLKEHAKETTCLAWAADGSSFASGSADATIKIWNPNDLKVTATLDAHKGSVTAVAYAPDSKILVSGGVDKSVQFWDLATQKSIGGGLAHDDAVKRIAVHPKGKLAASAGGDQRIVIWDCVTRRKLMELPTKHRFARSLVFSPDGQWLAVLTDTLDNLCVTPQIELFRSDALGK